MVTMIVIIITSMNDITAVIRLSNEAEWLPKCLESIIDIFDEILLCTQGAQKDNTIEICKEWSSKYDKVKYYHFYQIFLTFPYHNH